MLVAYSDSEDEEDKPSTTCAAPATRAPPCHPRCSATLPALRRGAAPPPPVAPAPPKKKQINLGQLLQQNDQELSLKEKLPANFFDAPAERDAGEDDDADAPPQKGWAGLSALLPPPTARPKSTGGASSLYARAQKLGSGRPKKLTLPPDPEAHPNPEPEPHQAARRCSSSWPSCAGRKVCCGSRGRAAASPSSRWASSPPSSCSATGRGTHARPKRGRRQLPPVTPADGIYLRRGGRCVWRTVVFKKVISKEEGFAA